MAKPEKTVEDYLVAGVEARDGWCAKMVDAGRKGAPDRECRFPEGVLVYVETKAKTGVLKSWQARYRERLEMMGFPVLACYTKEQIDLFLSDYDRGFYS